jgi:hypothetical protein
MDDWPASRYRLQFRERAPVPTQPSARWAVLSLNVRQGDFPNLEHSNGTPGISLSQRTATEHIQAQERLQTHSISVLASHEQEQKCVLY